MILLSSDSCSLFVLNQRNIRSIKQLISMKEDERRLVTMHVNKKTSQIALDLLDLVFCVLCLVCVQFVCVWHMYVYSGIQYV